MSDKANYESRLGKLHVQAGAGVEMRILRSDLSEVARGSGMFIVNVPEGIYAVEWLSAGKRTESIVRVKASSEPTLVTYSENSEDASDSGRKFSHANEIVSYVGALRRPSERNYGAWITVVLSVPEEVSAAKAMAPTRLLDHVGNPMRANDDGQADLELSGREAARVYHVKPGTYRLAFHSVMGETIEQTIPAMRNRGTIVFMHATSSEILRASGDAYAREKRDGIDSARTIIVSVNGKEDDRRIRERVRLAGVLLHDIAYGVGSLSEEFIKILDDPATDPLLRLYASLAVLSGLEQGRSPAIEGPRLADGYGSVHDSSEQWAGRAARWIGSLGDVGAPPDRVAAWWRLSYIAPESVEQWGYRRIAKQIKSPPMLECSWRWAITRSVGDRNAIPVSPALLGATRSPVGAGPWLCWKSAAAKAAPKKLSHPLPVEWSPILASISAKATNLMQRSTDSDYHDLFQRLSPEVGDTALKVTNLGSESMAGSSISSAQEDLALSLALPGSALMRRLVRTEAEVSKALDQLSMESDRSPGKAIRTESGVGLDEAPALSRRIHWADDPHKGRFGGHAQQMGFRATATFTHNRSRDWTNVHITVDGEVPEGTPAHFYLHDSFIPDKRVVSFRRGKAQLVLTAWGAFTVGVWIPKQGVELELDLALVDEAPSPFRER